MYLLCVDAVESRECQTISKVLGYITSSSSHHFYKVSSYLQMTIGLLDLLLIINL